MPSLGKTIAISAGTLVMGMSWGLSVNRVDHVVDTRIIKVPEIKVLTKTVTERPPLPDSCKWIVNSSFDDQERITDQLSKATGQIRLGLDRLDQRVYEKSVPAVNSMILFIQEHKKTLDTAAIDLAVNRKDIEKNYDICHQDLESIK